MRQNKKYSKELEPREKKIKKVPKHLKNRSRKFSYRDILEH